MGLTVLQICLSLEVGGAEQVVIDLARHIREFGFNSHIVLLRGRGSLIAEAERSGIRVHCMDIAEGFKPGAALKLANLARSLGADLLHAHNRGPGLYAGLAGLFCTRPVLVTRHDSVTVNSIWVVRLNSYLCNTTVCVGREVLDTCRNRDGVPDSRLELIYNGVDIEQLQQRQGVREQTRAGLGIAPDEPLLISVGRLAPVKNYSLLIQAMDDLPDTRLILVGDGPLRNDLEQQVKALGLMDRVHLLGERHDVSALLHASDLFVMSSDNEGISKALLEAMAIGLPCVVTAVGGNPEVVIDEATGLLFNKNDCHGLIEKVKGLLGDPGLMMRMGWAAAQRVRDNFSMAACVKQYTDLYHRILKQG